MRVVHIGTADNRGGAARAAFELHQGLLRSGQQSCMLVNQRFEDRPEIDRIGFSRSLAGRALNRALLETERFTGLQNLLQPHGRAFVHHAFMRGADVVQLHNLHGNFFPHRILPRLSRRAPVVWTLHDAWALTGHCAYNFDCERWRQGCGGCPRLSEYPPITLDTTALLWRVKKNTYEKTDLTVVAPSRWLAQMARESPLLTGHDVHCIPYSVDVETFRPIPQAEARRELGISPDAKVLMAMVMPGGERKGARFIGGALHRVVTRPVTVLVVGGGILEAPSNAHLHHIGSVDSPSRMNLCYAAADLFVLPTLADNLPVSILESFASSTPVVGFEVGGVPDLIGSGETGYLARYADEQDLARGIDALLSDPVQLARMREICRARAVADFSPDVQVNRYLNLYVSVIQRREQQLLRRVS